ncbi:MAG TPA: aminopeptidase [Spirochaetia bacterium]|nr:aminopeptidase [Spirochaetia bacterium]
MKKCVVAICLMLLSMLLFQCYFIREGAALLDVYGSGESLEASLADPSLPADERALLQLVVKIKRYAIERLGLAQNDNYSRYVRLDRDYLVSVVSAYDRLSFTQHEYHYPFVGALPYKGFFNPEDAASEARGLEAQGLDVHVRRVDAFSTLGILSDPVFSFMKDYPVFALSNLIFHEQSHATVFINGQATFNENFATFVGDEAMRLFLKETYGPASDEARLVDALDHDQRVFIERLRDLYENLKVVYAGKVSAERKLVLKEETIAAWQEAFRRDYTRDFLSTAYESFPERPLNNAVIMLYMTYREKQTEMKELFELTGKDLPFFISLARKVPRDTDDPLAVFRELIVNSAP